MTRFDVTARQKFARYGASRRVVCAAALGVIVALGGGCQVIAFIGQGFAKRTVDAVYTLGDRPTLVLVDDPSDQIGDPSLPTELAYHIGAQLVEQGVLDKVISPAKVRELELRLGSDYARTPIDRIGRELGAEQVIFVYVRSVELSPEPGLFRPTAVVDVKVIDARLGTRLYPAVRAADPTLPQPPPHHRVSVKMPYRTAPDYGRNTIRLVRQLLVKRIARNVARLFHDHVPRQPGQGFDD